MSQMLDLEIIETPFFSFSKVSWLGFFMAAISLVVSILTWQAYQAKHAEYANIELKLYQLNQKEQKKLPAKQVVMTISPEKIKQLQDMISVLTTPWDELFEAIEQSDKKDIALLGLEPDSQKQRVVITGEAKNLQAALGYIEQLEKQPILAQVFLQQHNIDETSVSKQVSFTVVANWNMAK
jgi:hypothetical protein